ncbi:MAG: right-handed parallel beta-helix repeat-containing protein [Bacteroidota bacterium]
MRKLPYLFSFLCLLIQSALATDYYVSPDGNDQNLGTLPNPFLTIQKAAEVMKAGDICYIRAGTYRETIRPSDSGTPGNPIVFQAYQQEQVIITGMEELNGWESDGASTYSTTVDWTLGDDNMVMYQGQLCDLARWPNNIDQNPFTLDAAVNTDGGDNYLSHPDLPDWDWANGGSLFYLGNSRWTSWRSHVTGASKGTVNFTLPGSWVGGAHNPSKGGEFYLQGIKAALDAPYEWFLDTLENKLYLQTPDGAEPLTGSVQMKQREWSFNLENRNYIQVNGINTYGVAINLKNSNHCRVYDCAIYYGNHTLDINGEFLTNRASIILWGSNNTVEQCEIAYGSSSGIWVLGKNHTVKNNHIHDFDYLATYDAPLNIRGGEGGHQILNNTIFNGGRDCIQSFGQNTEIAYNDVSRSNLINDDCGLYYTCCSEHRVKIHHNYFHDAQSRGSHYKAAGIYLDNDTHYAEVYRNVVTGLEWTAVQINWDGWYIDIFNNTFWDNSAVMGAWHKEGTFFKEVKIYNNLSDEGSWDGTDVQDNMVMAGNPFVNAAQGDFQLKNQTDPIDQGRIIDGFTDNHQGAGPDIGAFEHGGETWQVGINWNPTERLLMDCNGVLAGDAVIDACGECTGGNTGREVAGSVDDCRVTGVLGNQPDSEPYVYPNPVHDSVLNVHLGSIKSANYQVQNILGEVVKQGKLTQQLPYISVSGMPSGNYIVLLENASREPIMQRKIIVR